MRTMLVVALSLLIAPSVAAQQAEAWPERVFVALDVPFEVLNNDFSESLSFADPARTGENVVFGAGYESARGALLDAGAGVRLINNLGAGATVSWLRQSLSGSFDLGVPSPIVANRPLALTGSVSELTRHELGVHIQALYALALGTNTRVMLSGGPSIFDIRQEVVRTIDFEKLPGFVGIVLHEASIAEVAETTLGFNAGADVTWLVGSHFGVSAMGRFARATATFDPGAESGVSRAIEVRAGGLQIGGGIRVRF